MNKEARKTGKDEAGSSRRLSELPIRTSFATTQNRLIRKPGKQENRGLRRYHECSNRCSRLALPRRMLSLHGRQSAVTITGEHNMSYIRSIIPLVCIFTIAQPLPAQTPEAKPKQFIYVL